MVAQNVLLQFLSALGGHICANLAKETLNVPRKGVVAKDIVAATNGAHDVAFNRLLVALQETARQFQIGVASTADCDIGIFLPLSDGQPSHVKDGSVKPALNGGWRN